MVAFLKKHQDKLLIHHSAYENFRETVLTPLEEGAAIDHTYLPPATPAQLREHQLDVTPEKLLYLRDARSEEHTSELQSLMRISYAVFCLKKKKKNEEHKSTLYTK